MTTDIHALAGAYVLDAVDDLERAAFARHLDECAACRTEVDELRETASRLADGTFSVPPPRLRADVMAAVGRTRQIPAGSAPLPQRDPGVVVSRWRRFAAGAAAASILAVGAGVATYAIQGERVERADRIAAAAQAEVSRTRAILTADDVVFRTGAVNSGGRVTVAMSPAHNVGVVLLEADAAPPPGKVFQFWTFKGGAGAVNAGVLPTGTASTVHFVDGMPANTAFAMTIEPAGGSPTPTSEPVAKVPLV